MNKLYLASFMGLNSALDDYENKEIVIEAPNAVQAARIWKALREKHKLTCGDYEWKKECHISPLKIYKERDTLRNW